jgi:hypothetical protein
MPSADSECRRHAPSLLVLVQRVRLQSPLPAEAAVEECCEGECLLFDFVAHRDREGLSSDRHNLLADGHWHHLAGIMHVPRLGRSARPLCLLCFAINLHISLIRQMGLQILHSVGTIDRPLRCDLLTHACTYSSNSTMSTGSSPFGTHSHLRIAILR